MVDINILLKTYPLNILQDEANYIIVEVSKDKFELVKKPDDCSVESFNDSVDVMYFISTKDNVLLIRESGTYQRYICGELYKIENDPIEGLLSVAIIGESKIDEAVVE